MTRGPFAFLLSLGFAASALAGPVRVPGTQVTLDPPSGFLQAERYPGFENAARRSSIMVTELPGSSEVMRRGMTRRTLASRGMVQLGRETVLVAGRTGLLIHVRQEAGGEEFLKWMLITGDTKRTVMVVGTFPQGDPGLSQTVRRAVLSTAWNSAAPTSKLEGITFRVDPTPKLRLAGRVGNLLVFSESGKMESGNPAEGVLIVGSSFAEASVTDVEAFARERATKTTRVGPLRDIEGRPMTTDGLPGYELIGTANDAKDGREIRMYQLVLADSTTYYLAQGYVAPDRAPALIDQFRQVTASFRRVGLKRER